MFAIFAPAFASPSLNRMLNYQLRLTDTNGIPVADGAKSLKLTIYDAASAGTQLYTACSADGSPTGTPTAVQVTFTGGTGSTLIGSTSVTCASGSAVAIPATLFNADQAWLGVTVATDAEMTPRKRIVASAYSLNADRLDDLETSAAGGLNAYVPVTDSSGNLTLSANVTVDTDTLFVDSANNRVGVGTASPATNLHVIGSVQIGSGANIVLAGETLQINPTSGNASYLLDRPSSTDYASADWITGGNISTGWSQQMQPSDTGLHFFDRAAAVTRLYLQQSTGNVGIGDTSPDATLQVNGTVSIGPTYALHTGVYDFVVNSANGGIILNRTGAQEAFIRITVDGAGGGQVRAVTAGGLRFTDFSSVTEWARFDGTGKLGIGTTSPANKLDVEGGAAIGSTYSGTSAAPSNGLIVEGNVGFGTTSPSNGLSVVKSGGLSQMDITSYNAAPGSNRAILSLRTADGTEGVPGNVVSGDTIGEIIGQGYATGAFRAVAAMNFGVGTGTISATSLPSYASIETTPDGSVARVERMRIDQNGFVGIGTTAPGKLLEIQKTLGVATEDAFIILDSDNDTAGSGTSIEFKNNNATGAGFYSSIAGIDDADKDGRIEFRVSNNAVANTSPLTSSDTVMTIKQTGFVGIGTTGPGGLLHLSNATNPNFIIDDTNGWGSGDSVRTLTLRNAGTDIFAVVPNATNWPPASSGGLKLMMGLGNREAQFDFFNYRAFGGVNTYDMIWTSANAGATDFLERMRISGHATTANVSFSNSNVGIGNAAPLGELHVSSVSTSNASRGITSSQHSDSIHAAQMNFLKSRGTFASPTTVVNGDYIGTYHFKPYVSTSGYIFTSTWGARVNGTVTGTSAPTEFFVSTSSTNDGDPFTSGNVRLLINATGSVGIGDNTPDALLDVAGSFQFDGDAAFGDAATDNIIFNADVNSSILPNTDDTYDLGSNAQRWRDLYLGPATLHIGTATLDEGALTYDTTTNVLGIDSTGAVDINGGSGSTGCSVDASGNLACSGTVTGGGGAAFQNGGNSFAAAAILGTNDANSLSFETNNVTYLTIASGGGFTLPVDTDWTLTGGVNGLSFDGTTFSVDATNNRIGIGTAAPTARLHIVENTFTLKASEATGLQVMSSTAGGWTNLGTNLTTVPILTLQDGNAIETGRIDGNGYFGLYTGLTPNERFTIGDAIGASFGSGNLLVTTGSVETAVGGIGRYENYLLRSEEIENASWTKESTVAVTADTDAAPDGTTTADKVTTGGAAAGNGITQAASGAPATASTTWTGSVWLKATSGTPSVSLRVSSGNQTGTAVAYTLGNFWRRANVTQTFTGASTGTATLRIESGTNTNVLVWGAQLEKQASTGVYVQTASAAVTSTNRGLVINPAGNSVFQGGSVGIGTSSPQAALHVNRNAGADPSVYMADGDVAHGMTDAVPTDVLGKIGVINSTSGGLDIQGYNDGQLDEHGTLRLWGVLGDSNNANPVVVLRAGTKSGTTTQNLGDNRRPFQFQKNSGTALMTIMGNGDVGIGLGKSTTTATAPDAVLDVSTSDTGARTIAANVNGRVVRFAGSLNEASSGTHAVMAGLELTAPTINNSTAVVTDAATLYVSGAPAASGANNYALFADSGASRFDGAVSIGTDTAGGAMLKVLNSLTSDNILGIATAADGGSQRIQFGASGSVNGSLGTPHGVMSASAGLFLVIDNDGNTHESDFVIARNGSSTTSDEILRVTDGGAFTTPFGGFGRFENHVTYSEQVDHANWTKTGVTITANSTTAPDGTTTADTVGAGGLATDGISQAASGSPTSASTTWSGSVWMRTASGTATVTLRIDSSNENNVSTSRTVTTGWQRYTLTNAAFTVASTGTPTFKVVNGTSAIIVWGAQLERAQAVNAYVRTEGTAITSAARGFVAQSAGPHVFASGNVGIGNPNPASLFTVGSGDLFNVNSSGDVTSNFTVLNGSTTANGAGASSTTLVLTSATNFDVGNYVKVDSTNCVTGVNTCYAKITAISVNTLTISPAISWANASAVTEVHVPEVGGLNLTQALANRYGRGYFIDGVVTGNGSTYFTDGSIESGGTLKINSVGNQAIQTGTGTFTVNGQLVTAAGNNFNVDSGTLFVDATNNRVGVLDTTPEQTASVDGGLFVDNSASNHAVFSTTIALTVDGASGADILHVRDFGANRVLVVDSTGKVGIGDTSPAALLTVGNGDLFQVNSSGLLFAPSGSETAPSLSFTADTNSGLFSGGADIVGIATGGIERLRVDASGNVGINVPNPFQRFQVQGTETAGTGTISSSGTTVTGTGTTFTTQLQVNDTIIASDGQVRRVTAISLDTSLVTDSAFSPVLSGATFTYSRPRLVTTAAGRVGIGEPAPGGMLDIECFGCAVPQLVLNDSTVADSDTRIRFQNNGSSQFTVGYDESATGFRISDGATLGTNDRFGIDGTSGYVGAAVLAAATANSLCYSTTVMTGFNSLSTCSSSIRYKEDVRDLEIDVSKVLALRPVDFKWKDRDERSVGFIAEEVEQLIPQVITYKDGVVEGIEYKLLTAYLVGVLKDHQARIDALSGSVSLDASGNATFVEVHADKVATKSVEVNANDAAKRTVGREMIEAGYDAKLVANVEAKTNSLVIVTFDADPGQRHWIAERHDGSFLVKLSGPALQNATFTYWIVGIDGALAEPVPTTAGPEAPPVTAEPEPVVSEPPAEGESAPTVEPPPEPASASAPDPAPAPEEPAP